MTDVAVHVVDNGGTVNVVSRAGAVNVIQSVRQAVKIALPGPQGPPGDSIYEDLDALEAASVPAPVIRVYVKSYDSTVGPEGGAWYKRAASEPSHSLKVQDALDAWWEVDEPVISVDVAGAVLDGVTDDGPAISAAFEAIRDQTGFKTPILIPPGDYYIGTSIDATDIRPDTEAGGVRIFANGARFLANCTGKPVIDCTNSLQLAFEGLTVIGDDTNVPLCAFQFARGSDGVVASSMSLSNITTKGHYSRAAVYNFASEVFSANNCIIRNYASGADKFAFIIDGQNYYGATSAYSTITVPQYTSQSCLNHAFNTCTFGSGGADAVGSFMHSIGASRISMVGCYGIARGNRPGIQFGILNASSAGQNYDFDIHMEPENHIDYNFFVKDLSGGVQTSATFDNFFWKENSLHAGVAVFGSDMTGRVSINQFNMAVSSLRPSATSKIFDHNRFSVYGDINWTVNSAPTGLNIDFFNGRLFCSDFSGVSLPAAGTYDTVDFSGTPHPVTRYGNVTYATNVYSNGPLIGYTTGAGGSVTQDTSKTTAVELNKACGSIVTHAANLAAGAIARFTFTNSYITTTTFVGVHRRAGGANSSYNVWVDSLANGSAEICIQNITGGDLAQAVTIRFIVFNVVTS